MSILTGFIVKTVLETAVKKVLNKAADNPAISVGQDAVKPVTAAVTKELEQQMADVIENQTNQEPWYRSRVLLGSYGTVFVAIGSIVQMVTDDVPDDLTTYWPHVTVLATAAFAIYGRLAAGKALGR